MRRSLILAVAVITACASASPPPGGPEDKEPPKLVRVTPDTNALNTKVDNASFYFDEVINDRGAGTQEVGSYFLVSPSDGEPHVSWHRSRIDVRPRKGFRPNTAYVITLLPGLTDLRNNKMKAGTTLVFSTGSSIPKERINGIAFDWAAEKPAAQAYIEAITPDSIVYLAQADTIGHFSVGPLPPGTYLVRALIDANNNRTIDRNEMFDTVRVTVPQANPVELLAAVRDTFATRLGEVSIKDSVTLVATFSRGIDPSVSLVVSQFRLVTADSAEVPITNVYSPRALVVRDSLAAAVKSDSVRRADSLAGRPLPPVAQSSPAAGRQGGKAAAPLPKPSRLPPFTMVTLKLASPLKPSTAYRLSVSGLRSLAGLTEPSSRGFTTPKPPPPPPRDTTAAGRDSTRARPATPPARAP